MTQESTEDVPPLSLPPTSGYAPIGQEDVPEDMRTMSAEQLASLLHRTARSIVIDLRNKPHTLPPPFKHPQSRRTLFRVVDVRKWMEGVAKIEQDRRRAQREASARLNDDYNPMVPMRQPLDYTRRLRPGQVEVTRD